MKSFKIKTSKEEIKDLLKAWIAISLAFSILITKNIMSKEIIYTFAISAFTVGTGFLLHELAHKITAQKYGCHAEFRAFNQMLVIAIITAFFGFIFAAPGAVMISGYINNKKNGRISLAGPLTNLILALIFLALSFKFSSIITLYGFRINSWLALFNMVPFLGLDGQKVLNWNKTAYAIFTAAAFILTFLI